MTDVRAAGRVRGGKARSTTQRAAAALPPELADLRDHLVRAMGAVEGGSLTAGQAGAIAALARSLLSVYESAEVSAASQRLREVERRLKALDRVQESA